MSLSAEVLVVGIDPEDLRPAFAASVFEICFDVFECLVDFVFEVLGDESFAWCSCRAIPAT